MAKKKKKAKKSARPQTAGKAHQAPAAERSAPPTRKKRQRRSDEELIGDLQARIRELHQRQRAQELRKSPAMNALLGAIAAVDRALSTAAGEGETMMRHVLADARRPLTDYAQERGLSVPSADLPRGRRPRGL